MTIKDDRYLSHNNTTTSNNSKLRQQQQPNNLSSSNLATTTKTTTAAAANKNKKKTVTKCIILRPKRDFSDLRLVCLCEQPIQFNYSPDQVPPELLLAIDTTNNNNDRVDLETWQKTHRAVRRLLQRYIRGQCCMAPLGFTCVLLPLIIWHTQVTRKANVKRFAKLAREQSAIYQGFGIVRVEVYREFLEGSVESCGLKFYINAAPENEND